MSGFNPMVASTLPILADSLATIRSAASASSSPPPTHTPCTAATMGMGSWSKTRSSSVTSRSGATPRSALSKSAMSAPAQKLRSPLRSSTARLLVGGPTHCVDQRRKQGGAQKVVR
jgi:hypothetical protein